MGSFSIWHWLFVGLIVYVLVRAVMAMFGLTRGKKAMVCTTCGHHGQAVVKTRGSILIEIVLWLLLIVPGLIYSIWRVSSRADACASCGAATLVPDTSPIGRKLLADSSGR